MAGAIPMAPPPGDEPTATAAATELQRQSDRARSRVDFSVIVAVAAAAVSHVVVLSRRGRGHVWKPGSKAHVKPVSLLLLLVTDLVTRSAPAPKLEEEEESVALRRSPRTLFVRVVFPSCKLF